MVGIAEDASEVTVKGSALVLYPEPFVTDTLYVPKVMTCEPNPLNCAGTVKDNPLPSNELRFAITPCPKRTELPLVVNPEPYTVTVEPTAPDVGVRDVSVGRMVSLYGRFVPPQ